MEEIEELTPSDRKIRRLKELAKEHVREFEERHVDVLSFIVAGDSAALKTEETVFDEHVDRVTDFIERLEQLEDKVGTTEPVMPHASYKGDGRARAEVRSIFEAEHLSRRWSQVHDSLAKVKRVVLEKKETDMCLLESHEDRLKSINTDLMDIKRDVLLIDDYESLAGKADGLEVAVFELRVAIKCLLKTIKAESAVDKDKGRSGVKLPNISVPTFPRLTYKF